MAEIRNTETGETYKSSGFHPLAILIGAVVGFLVTPWLFKLGQAYVSWVIG